MSVQNTTNANARVTVGLSANRPLPANVDSGHLFLASDTSQLYGVSIAPNGVRSWVQVTGTGGGGVLAGDVIGPIGANTLAAAINTTVAWGPTGTQTFTNGLLVSTAKSISGVAELNLKAAAGDDIFLFSGTNNDWRFRTSGTLDMGGGDANTSGAISVPENSGCGLYAGGSHLIAGVGAGPIWQYGDASLPWVGIGNTVQLKCPAGTEIEINNGGIILLCGAADPGGSGTAVLSHYGTAFLWYDNGGTESVFLDFGAQQTNTLTVGNNSAAYNTRLMGNGITFTVNTGFAGEIFPSGGLFWGTVGPADPGQNNITVGGKVTIGGTAILNGGRRDTWRVISDANFVATTADLYIAYNALTSSRTGTVPGASPAGTTFRILDTTGNASVGTTISVTPTSGVIHGGTGVINSAFGGIELVSDGTNYFQTLALL